MGRRSSAVARQYCTVIDNNRNHLCCKFCGHTLWGITRFKEHLAQKRGDVMPCSSCPKEVSIEMAQELIQLSLKREEKERRTREELQCMLSAAPPSSNADDHHQERPVAAAVDVQAEERALKSPAVAAFDVETEERALMEQAIQESLITFQMENKAFKYGDGEFEAARRASMRSFHREECFRNGEGCSRSWARPSSSIDDYCDSDSSS